MPNVRELWSEAITGLLADPVRRGRIAARARADFLARLTTTRAAGLVIVRLERAFALGCG